MQAAGPPRVLLVRHGETEFNRLGYCQGWLDAPLNHHGGAQAREVGTLLAGRRLARVIASPLRRAWMTAEAIASHHGLVPESEPDLRELYHGRLEGVRFEDLDHHVPGIREAWRRRPHTVAMPDGETLQDLQVRAGAAFDRRVGAYLEGARNGGPYGDLVLVAHALTISSILCRVGGHGLEGLRQYRLEPCGFWELERDEDAWRVAGSHRRMPPDIAP